MRFSNAILLGLLFAVTKADQLVSTKCSKQADLAGCVDSLNSDLMDGTKCLPIVQTSSNEELGKGAVMCSSWKDI